MYLILKRKSTLNLEKKLKDRSPYSLYIIRVTGINSLLM